MSSIWYEYLEETGGEIIPINNFSHVCRSFEKCNDIEIIINCSKNEVRFAYNYESDFWWPVIITEQLSEGWIKLEYYGIEQSFSDNCMWCDLKSDKKSIKSIKCCLEQNLIFKLPNSNNNCQLNMETIFEDNRQKPDLILEYSDKNHYMYQTIKIGAYLECWLENSVGFVWPVKVLSNIGGRLKMIWFGCDPSSSKPSTTGNNNNGIMSMFYLDYRLHSLGWARLNGWKYSPPLNIGINISISNVDTFVRGSPTAFPMEMGCEREIGEHFFEEGWQMEAVNPVDPGKIHVGTVRYVLDNRYFLVEIEKENGGSGERENGRENGSGVDSMSIMFAAFGGMAELLPANTSSISGYRLMGLRGADWQEHLMSGSQLGGPTRYAPHLGYFRNGGGSSLLEGQRDSAFLPGGKLEAVVPWNRHVLHAATVVRAMDGSRLVWLRSDCEPDAGDWLVDPTTSTDLFPAGWAEMVGHGLVLPPGYGSGVGWTTLFSGPPLDPDDVTVVLRPDCHFIGPYLSRSLAAEMLPRCIGPGHCVPVFRALFDLLIKVSHKPYKLMRLLQCGDRDRDRYGDIRELMATIAVPSPKTEWSGRSSSNKRADWLIEVAVRKRAVATFCRQIALAIGACPSFIGATSGPHSSVSAAESGLNASSLSSVPMAVVVPINCGCEARLTGKCREKMSAQRRKRLFFRPLTALGISYRQLRSRGASNVANSNNNSSGTNSDADSSPDNNQQASNVIDDPSMNVETIDSATVTNGGGGATGGTNAMGGGSGGGGVCTRGMRLIVVPDAHRLRGRHQQQQQQQQRSSRRRSTIRREQAMQKHDDDGQEEESVAAAAAVNEIESPREAFDVRDYVIDPTFLAGDIERVELASNPLHWSVEQLTEYVAGTDCRQLASWLANERVDGRAFLLLTLPVLSTLYGLQLELAIRLCRHVVSLKRVFIERYADMQQLLLPDDV